MLYLEKRRIPSLVTSPESNQRISILRISQIGLSLGQLVGALKNRTQNLPLYNVGLGWLRILTNELHPFNKSSEPDLYLTTVELSRRDEVF